MKSTFSQLPSFWVKVLPLMLVLFSIGITRTQAQNYKPFDEAVTAVSNAIDLLKADGSVKNSIPKSTSGNGQAKTSAMTPAQSGSAQLTTFEITYFELFMLKAKQAGDIAQAVIDLDATVNAQGQPASRVTTLNTGRANLIALITN